MENPVIHYAGLIFSILLPFFNLPLIYRMIQRKSSSDMSLTWAIGVWVCIVGMAPAAWSSTDKIFRLFSVMNLFFFSGVVIFIIYFRVVKRKLKK